MSREAQADRERHARIILGEAEMADLPDKLRPSGRGLSAIIPSRCTCAP